MSLDYLAREIGGPILPIRGIGGIPVEPVGFIMMNVKVLMSRDMMKTRSP